MPVWKSVVAMLNISHVFFETHHVFETMYHVDCPTTNRSQIFWLVVWDLKNMRDILYFICLLLPTIKKTSDFLHAFIKIVFPFEQYLILNVSVNPNFRVLNRYLYVLYKLWLYQSYLKLWKYSSLAPTLPLGST